MFEGARKSGQLTSGPLRTGSMCGVPGSASVKKTSSGPLNKHGEPIRKTSGPQGGAMTSRQNSGPLPPVLPTTGLITSGPILKAVIKFISEYPDAELRTAKDGQFVKVSGVVTCGNVPLESSFQKVPRCVYTSTSLYEYRGCDSKAANPTHRRFTWGLRSLERHAVDFYISDFHSGLRALVKTGYGARVTPYVEESAVIDIDPSNKNMSSQFKKWLAERNLSTDDRVLRLKEGYGT
nr:uncharacterized membrane protein At1g16860-like isoform X2 [Tanacetum cinerariifolium]